MRALLLAMVIHGLSFPGQFKTEYPPRPPDPSKIEWDSTRSYWHNMKNQVSETVRADVEFWSKLFLFLILVQIFLLLLLLALIAFLCIPS